MTALIHRAPQRGTEHVERLYALFEEHGEEAMPAALREAVESSELNIPAVLRALSRRRGGAR